MNLRFLETAKAEFWERPPITSRNEKVLAANLAARFPKHSTGLLITRTRGVLYLRGHANVALIGFLTLLFTR